MAASEDRDRAGTQYKKHGDWGDPQGVRRSEFGLMRWRAEIVALLLVSACSHPEDRRWASLLPPATTLPEQEQPTIQVYAFEPPGPPAAATTLKSLSDQGQRALIEWFARTKVDPTALKQLAGPLEGSSGSSDVDRARLNRTIVISVGKGPASQPGDRLIRTRVTITPQKEAENSSAFEFAGYTVAATDTKVQNIAHLEDETDTTLTATLAPPVATGGSSLQGSASRSRKSSADIVQQYENLNVDIGPDQLVITRESERGLDVVGNTLVALALAAPDSAEPPSAFLGSSLKLFAHGQPLSSAKAGLEVKPLSFFARCPLKVDVTLDYQLRRIATGREYYTEGKQSAQIVTASVQARGQTLIRASDAQSRLYLVLEDATRHGVLAKTADGDQRAVFFDTLDEAREFAVWLTLNRRSAIGAAGLSVNIDGKPLRPHAHYHADLYSAPCPNGGERTMSSG